MKKLLLLCVFLTLSISNIGYSKSSLQIGDEIPDITLTDLQGKKLDLPDDMKGKVLLIHFFGMDCHFCDKEILLQLEPLYQKYKAKGFVPIAVNIGAVDKKDPRWKKFTALTYPLLIDEYAIEAKKFGVIGLPTTFVIDGEGVVQNKLTGEGKMAEYEKLFTTVLQQGESK